MDQVIQNPSLFREYEVIKLQNYKEKHIKSVLVGMDGSTVKSIAFNCVENEIGAYLLKKDKNYLILLENYP